jgi:hypothetical protein
MQPINQLAGVSTRSMNRLNPEEVINDLDDAFDIGDNKNGSDMFIVANNEDIPPNTEIVDENQKAIDDAELLNSIYDELNKQEKDDIYEESKRIEEQDAIDEENRQIETAKQAYVPQPIKNYKNVEALKEIAATNDVSFNKSITKAALYDKLLKLQLV